MPRYIDADALMKVIREHDYPLRSHFNSTDNGMFTIGVQQAVDEAPTIDAVPVVRGYSYEDDKTYSGPGTSNYICSVCGEMQGTWKKGLAQNQKFKFCPWCGAKMEDKPCG